MTTLHEAATKALEALEHLQPSALTSFYTIGARDKAIEALREALAQQDDLSNASKSEQLLASCDHSLRAEFQRTKAALAQQGEQQPVGVVAPWPDIVDWTGAVPAVGTNLYTEAQPNTEPFAYSYELATLIGDGVYSGWSKRITEHLPDVEGGALRNLVHLYASAPAAQPLTRAQIDALADDGAFLGNVYEITRAIELHHGIGADK